MTRMVYFDHLADMLTLFDDELLVHLLERVELELDARGRFDARNYVARARAALVPARRPSGSSSR